MCWVGLGFLTKGTAYIYGSLLGCFATLIFLTYPNWNLSRKSIINSTVIGILIVGLINISFFHRMPTSAGKAPEVVSALTWATAPISTSAKRITSQIVREVALQFTWLNRIPVTNGFLSQSVSVIHKTLNLPVGDTEIGLDDHFKDFDNSFVTSEDYAGNPIHFFLFLILFLLTIFKTSLRKDSKILGLFFFSLIAWSAAAIEIKFMPWNSRLLLPVFFLFAVPVAITLFKLFSNKNIQTIIVIGLLVSTLPYLLLNPMRPLITFGKAKNTSIFNLTRWDNYFRNQPEFKEPIERILNEIPKECSNLNPVGLIFTSNTWEYPFWVGSAASKRKLSFKHIPADSSESGLCLVITTTCLDGSAFCIKH